MRNLADHLEEIVGKTVLVRANFDVPIEDGVVADTTRIEDVVSTIQSLSAARKIILMAHAGRPEGHDPSLSLAPVASELSRILSTQVALVPFADSIGESVLPDSRIVLLENLRFWKGEEANDPEFAAMLAKFGQVYVNQAFANCHRDHASMTSLPRLLPSVAGINLAKEVELLLGVRNNPTKPLVVIIGGSKIETKLPLISVFAPHADSILVGGKCAHEAHEQGLTFADNVIIAQLDESGKDITDESAKVFADKIAKAATVIWNGTMGVYEEPEHMNGTRIVAQAVNSTPATTVVGGGDTETALTMLELESGIDWISTGGGAMLELLSEGKLIALEVLS